ncbi:MAG: carbohydrate-binding domain-containing protein [Bacteroidetes bacterium]|nr:carbohydrate-binding domain-containing protein [Bacteroidota bacterium]
MRGNGIVLPMLCAVLTWTVLSCSNSTDSAEDAAAEGQVTVDMVKATTSVRSALAANSADHELPADYVWDAAHVIPIVLNGTSVTESTDSATTDGSTVTITSGGTYILSGSLNDGQVLVNAPDDGTVRVILHGIDIRNSTTSPFAVTKAEKVVLILADNTVNVLTDASSYVFPDPDEDEPNAALFSKADLTICGNGSLTVKGNYNDGIASKDGLIIKSGTITVNAVDDGIRGKDYLIIKDGTVTVTSMGDALKSDNDENATRGYISVESGSITATAGMDGLTAETDVIIAGGIFNLTTGGGNNASIGSSVSAKGIKGLVSVVIGDGTFAVNSADDAVHSNSTVVINGGSFALASGDDGVHADSLLGVNGGDIAISKCFEGLESCMLVINDGTIHIIANDDGINGAGGRDASGAGGWPGGMPSAGNYYLYIAGGYIAVTAAGDGIDVNGKIVMKDGTVLVHGPTSNGNGALDYDASFQMTGGVLLAAGSSGMAQAPSASSTQCALMVNFGSARPAGTLFHIQAADGSDILTFKPSKSYQSMVFGSPKLSKSATYDVYIGGNSTGTSTDGLYEGGTYSGGTKSTRFTVAGIMTRING